MHLVLVLAQAAVDVLLLAHALDVQVHRGVPRRVGREGGQWKVKNNQVMSRISVKSKTPQLVSYSLT